MQNEFEIFTDLESGDKTLYAAMLDFEKIETP